MLEDHGDVAIPRGDVVHHLAVNGNGAVGNFLKAGNEPQRRRHAAAGRADQHEQFLVRDRQIEIADSSNSFLPGPLEGFGQIFDDDTSHWQMVLRRAGKVERGVWGQDCGLAHFPVLTYYRDAVVLFGDNRLRVR